jgi:hypothetical protein
MDPAQDSDGTYEHDDPLYSEARKEVFKERLVEAKKKMGPPPKEVSGQTRIYRGDLIRMRLLAKWPTISALPAGIALSFFSLSILASFAGAIAVLGSIWLGVCLLREALDGAGLDIETQFLGPEGPYRKYAFQS